MHEIDPNAAPAGAEPAATTSPADPRRAGAPPSGGHASGARADRDTVRIESLVRATASRLVVDEATRITRIEILDPVTRQVLRAFPESDWLKVVRAARAMAEEAILDKRT